MKTDLQLVMWYTGWSKVMAECAIQQWKRYNPDWSAQFLYAYWKTEKP